MQSFRSPLLLLAAVLLTAAPSTAVTHRTHPLRLKLPPADCSMAAIPSGPAQGMIAGKIFRLGGASVSQSGASAGGVGYDNYLVTLEAPDGAGATLVIVATASLPQGQALDGKVFMRKAATDATEQPLAGPGQPQIADWGIHYDPGQVDADSLSGAASIRLEFGTRKAGALPGKIYFCEAGNTLAGGFTVDTSALP
jgi:hypothetical protein